MTMRSSIDSISSRLGLTEGVLILLIGCLAMSMVPQVPSVMAILSERASSAAAAALPADAEKLPAYVTYVD